MSCTALTRGRSIDCRNSAGGIKAVYIAPFDAITAVVIDGQVTDLDLSPVDLFKYNLKRGLGNVSESINGSTENGSIARTRVSLEAAGYTPWGVAEIHLALAVSAC